VVETGEETKGSETVLGEPSPLTYTFSQVSSRISSLDFLRRSLRILSLLQDFFVSLSVPVPVSVSVSLRGANRGWDREDFRRSLSRGGSEAKVTPAAANEVSCGLEVDLLRVRLLIPFVRIGGRARSWARGDAVL